MKKLLLVILLLASMAIVSPVSNIVKAQGAQAPSVTLSPSTFNATQLDQTVTFNIDISNAQNLWGYYVNVTYDSTYLTFQSASDGSFLTSQGATDFFTSTKPENYVDVYQNSYSKQVVTLTGAIESFSNGEDDSVSGSGTLGTVTFEVVNQTAGTTVLLGVMALSGPTATNAEPGTNPLITPANTSSTATVSLIIPGPPTANAGLEQTVAAGTTVTLNGSGSVSTGSNASYTWTFTDAGKLQTLSGITANYTFNNAGNYTVTLRVTDSLGTSNATTLIIVTGTLASPTPYVSQTPTPTGSISSATATPTAALNPTSSPQPTDSSSLPPVVVGILVFITILVLVGSIFWLRKHS